MAGQIDFIRWAIRAFPRDSFQRGCERWVERRVDRTAGPRLYDGIHGMARMVLDLSDRYEWRIYLNMRDAASIRVLRCVLKPGDVFVDAGANIGHYSVLAAHLVGPTGKVYAFEPQPQTLLRLHENINLNYPERVEIVPKGLWDAPGEAQIFLFNESGHHTASMGARGDRSIRQSVTVPTVRLDDVVHGPVKLIKVDVEGADWRALRGAEKLIDQSRPHLILEANDNVTQTFGYTAMEMIDWVLGRWPGYRMHRMKRLETRATDRDELDRALKKQTKGYFNVWFKPS